MSWLTGWQYRKSHNIRGSQSGAVTDYQIRITVHYGSGTDSGEHVYLNGKCRTDFGDIRFTSDDGVTELSYWMEYKVNGNYAIFWVKVPSIPKQPKTTTIYIYYGKSDATTTSNGESTFDFFNECENTNEWTKFGTDNSTISVDTSIKRRNVGSIKVQDLDSDLRYNWWVINFPTQNSKFAIAFDARMKAGTKPGYCVGLIYGGAGATSTWAENQQIYHTFEATAEGYLQWYDTQYHNYTTFTEDQWHKFEFIVDPISYTFKIYVDDTLKESNGVFRNAVGGSKQLGIADSIAAREMWIDSIRLRKYVEPEPSHGAWGSEETSVPTETPISAKALYNAIAILETPISSKALYNAITVVETPISAKALYNVLIPNIRVIVTNESVTPNSGFAGDIVTYNAIVKDEYGNPLLEEFIADLLMNSTVVVDNQQFVAGVYDSSTGELTLVFTVPSLPSGTKTVKLKWEEQTI